MPSANPPSSDTSVSTQLTALTTQLAVLNERLGQISLILAEHDRCLRGHNNTPGLVADVDDLKEGFSSIRKLTWTSLTAAVTAVCLLEEVGAG